MQNLLKSNILRSFIIILLLNSCVTSSYRVSKQVGGLTELLVTPDRIVIECEDVQDPDVKPDEDGRYGFTLSVLDDRKTVLSVIQGNVMDKKTCFDRVETLSRFFKRGKMIYIAGAGEMPDHPSDTVRYVDFPGKGRFLVNNRILHFMLLMNDVGDCFDAYNGTNKPCPEPGSEFPIK